MKFSKETFYKYAEAVGVANDSKDSTLDSLANATILTLGPGIEMGSKYITNKINDNVRQDNNIGEVFGEFARKELKKGKEYFTPVLKPSSPRAYGPLIKKDILPPWYQFIAHYPASVNYSIDEQSNKAMRDLVIEDFSKQLKDEMVGDVLATKLFHADPDEIKKVLDGIEAKDLSSYIAEKFEIGDSPAIVETPRNNLFAMAHEMGHIDDLNKTEGLIRKVDKVLPGAKPVLYDALDFVSGPAAFFASGKSPTISQWLYDLGKRNPLLKDTITGVFGGPIPGYITGGLAASQTARDAVRKVLPFEATDQAMDFVEEHPASVAASGFVPQLLNEAYTSIPGYDITKKFYEHLNELDPDSLAPKLKNELGHYAGRIGKFMPEFEALKFLGHNTLSNLTYAMAPITAAAIAYLNRPNKEKVEI